MAYEMGNPEIKAVARVIRGKNLFRYGQGEPGWQGEVSRFEKRFAQFCGVKYAVANSNGTASLISSLVALGVGKGDEVIVPGYTFIATAFAVLAVGAIPVIAEVDETLTLDVEDVRKKISSRTRCIIPVHMIGLVCDLEPLLRLARSKKIFVVEDCCQATGGSYKGKRVGSWGEMGAFSHNHYKTMSAGEAGTVITNNWKYFERARMYNDAAGYLLDPKSIQYHIQYFAGMNYRMNEVQGAILNQQLNRLPGLLRRMNAIKGRMHLALKGHPVCPAALVHEMKGDCGKVVVLRLEGSKLAIKLADKLNAKGVPTSSWFRGLKSDRHIYTTWVPILEKRGSYDPRQDPYKTTPAGRAIQYSKGMCPRTVDILSRSVAVNIWPSWSKGKVDQVLKTIERTAEKL
jgi:dTDP-4-amino-4,6-dideoxygalactose transaminase